MDIHNYLNKKHDIISSIIKCLGLYKGVFFAGLVFLSTLTSVNLLIFISMNNQECKVRAQIVDLNGDDPMFFPFSIK